MLFRIGTVIAVILSLALASCKSIPSPSISVADQDAQNKHITISEVSTDKAGWVVVHHANAAGELDASTNLIVLKLSSSGQYTDLQVPVTIVGDQTLFVRLYYDDPADGKFTYQPGNSEDPPVTVDGKEVVASFEVIGIPPAVDVSNQAIVNGTITITRIDIPATGWAVLVPATADGKPDLAAAVVIVSLPSEGEYTTVKVPFSTTVQKTMFIVLHLDNPADGVYTYQPGETDDLPVTLNGNVVADSFVVTP